MPRARKKTLDPAPSLDMASKTKFYAVKKGHVPGIYTTWADCSNQVQGYKGNMFKSFNSRIEAQQYMDDFKPSTSGPSLLQKPALSETVQKRVPKRPKSPTPLSLKRKHSYINTSMVAQPPSPQVPETYIPATQDDVYQVEYDGASKSNPGPAGAGALLRHPDGSVVCELREGLGSTTNNVAEYRAFILGLRGALDRGIYRVRVQGDSKLVCEQVLGRWKTHHPRLEILCKEAQNLMLNFSEFSIRHVDREFNSVADQLANEAVALPETKFVSSCNLTAEWEKWEGVSADAIAEFIKKRQSRGSKTYGAFDSLQSSHLRLACKSYCVGYRSPSMAGAQWFQNMFSSIKKTRAVVVVARPRVSCRTWIATRRTFTCMAVRLLL